eukprot:m.48730 g.48730  ORF g.48730 m.48730 type:complete len:204 (+) comp6058_c0_seq1:371-982(+)
MVWRLSSPSDRPFPWCALLLFPLPYHQYGNMQVLKEIHQFPPSSYEKLASNAEYNLGELETQIREQKQRFEEVDAVLSELSLEGTSVKVALTTMGVLSFEMEAMALLLWLKNAWNRNDQKEVERLIGKLDVVARNLSAGSEQRSDVEEFRRGLRDLKEAALGSEGIVKHALLLVIQIAERFEKRFGSPVKPCRLAHSVLIAAL